MKKETVKKIPVKKPEPAEENETPLMAGIFEVLAKHRKWIFRMAVFYLLISFSSLMFFSDYLMFAVNWPFAETGLKLNVFRLVDGLYIKIKAAFTLGLLVIIPVIVLGLRKILISAFGPDNRRFINLSVLFGLLLFYGGAVSSYFVIPMASKVLLSFTPDDMVNTINASQYFGFIIFFCLSMGVVFELPIVILVLSRIGIITPEFLVTKRKYAIVLAWIIAAVITPTVDPLTQGIVAVPLMLLYEISIVISKMMLKRKKRLAEE